MTYPTVIESNSGYSFVVMREEAVIFGFSECVDVSSRLLVACVSYQIITTLESNGINSEHTTSPCTYLPTYHTQYNTFIIIQNVTVLSQLLLHIA